ncbi:hypothetical protein CJF30_00001322 [Rutstroemia sp. NJR-2017a BBW]|nr:hypothetical protein CJF30_00001322 [Rutstroemia sp. NJR-2017a BBW]
MANDTGLLPAICFVVLLQLMAYLGLCIVAALAGLADYFTSIPDPNPPKGPSFCQTLFILIRHFFKVVVSMAALVYGVQALMFFPNLAVYSTLLVRHVSTYAFDALLFSLAYDLRLVPRDQGFDRSIVLWALAVGVLASTIVYADYRLNMEALMFAVIGIFCISLTRMIGAIGYQAPDPRYPSYGASLYFMLWGGLPPCLFLTIHAAFRFEDVEQAFSIVKTWDIWAFLANLAPGALTHVLWNAPLRSTLALSTTEGSPYAATEENLPDAIDTTLHLSVGLLLCSTFWEENILDSSQVVAFILIYVISVGPKEIALYIPRFVNSVFSLRRRTSISGRKMYQLWHTPILLCIVTLTFAILSSFGMIYWINIISPEHNSINWVGPKTPFLDITYRAPTKSRLEIVIAHSEGDPVNLLRDLITGVMGSQPAVLAHQPRIIIYTKQPNTEDSTMDIVERIRNTVGKERSIYPRPNIGGVTETYLNHILKNWEQLPTQTLFLTTSNHTIHNLDPIMRRLYNYYDPAAHYPAAENMDVLTGFLNLGEYTTCDCYSCYDSHGWNDTFQLIPSMWSASRPAERGQPEHHCKKALITHGNNFVASAARIHGVKKDVWETLGDALSNPSIYGWAHDRLRIGGKDREMYGLKDSLEKPFLGYTVERLWGVLLSCSTPEIAWKCPNLWRGWRNGGRKEDCACRD